MPAAREALQHRNTGITTTCPWADYTVLHRSQGSSLILTVGTPWPILPTILIIVLNIKEVLQHARTLAKDVQRSRGNSLRVRPAHCEGPGPTLGTEMQTMQTHRCHPLLVH